jgi:hypothetical protein
MFSIFDITDTARLLHSQNISELMDEPPSSEAPAAVSRRDRHEACTIGNRADFGTDASAIASATRIRARIPVAAE